MRAALLATALLVGCYDPSYDDGRVRCARPDPVCPDGYQCIADRCFKNGETPDLAGALSVVQLAGPSRVHQPHTVSIEANISQLGSVDAGTVTFTSSSGTLAPASCTRLTIDSARCTTVLTPDGLGSVTVMATSDDDGSVGSMDIQVGPAVVVSLPVQADVLAFGDAPPPIAVSATVLNLFDGEPPDVSWSLASGTSVQVNGGSIRATPIAFPATATPANAVVRATSVADPSVFADVTVHLHAWVDESAAVAALFPPTAPPQLWTVATSTTGEVLVGGRTLGTSHRPVAAIRSPTGTWSVALDGFNAAEGAITGATTTPADGRFVLSGVTGSPDTNGNRPLLVLHCATGSAACTLASNVAPPGYSGFAPAAVDGSFEDFAGGTVLPPIANPSTVVCTPAVCTGSNTYKSVLYNVRGAGCATGTNVVGNIVYDQMDDPPAGVGQISFVDDTSVASPNNTCPFSSTNNGGRVLLSNILNDGGVQAWTSGYAECTTSGCGSVNPKAGLVSNQIGIAGTDHTYQAQLVATDVLGPAVRAGYDGSLIGVGTLADPSNPGVTLLWFDKVLLPTPGGFIHVPAPTSTADVGLVANGGTTGAPWTPALDLWWSFTRKALDGSRSLGLGWLGSGGATAQSITRPSAGDGYQVLDLAFVGGAAGVDGWAVGHRLTSNGSVGPLVAHLH